MLTAIVAEDASVTNAFCQITAIAFAHYGLTVARSRSDTVARLLDGTPLILMEGGQWRAQTMRKMRVKDDDVMERARDQGLKTLDEIETAVLERNGEISIVPKEDD